MKIKYLFYPCFLSLSFFGHLWAQAVDTVKTDDQASLFYKLGQEAGELNLKYLNGALQEKNRRVFAKLTDGRVKYLSEDYRLSTMIFLELVENEDYRRQLGASSDEAKFYLADSFYHVNQLRSARSYFSEILPQATPQQKVCVLGRLLQISMDLEQLPEAQKFKDQALEALNKAPDSAIAYFLGKYSYSIGQYDEARALFARVNTNASVYPQSLYLQAVTYLMQKRYTEAITTFQGVMNLNLEALREGKKAADELAVDQQKNPCHFRSTQEQKSDVLGWDYIKAQAQLSIARIYYELNDISKAKEAYQKISSSSLIFKDAIEESVWLAIKEKNFNDALQKLDIQVISDPSLLNQPETRILQGRLLSIVNRYTDAESLFEEINEKISILKERFISPILLKAKGQLAGYFQQRLKEGNLTLNLEALLPKELRTFAQEKLSNSTARSLFVELAALQKDVDDSIKDIKLLEWALNASNQAERYPAVQAGLLKALEIKNQVLELHLQNHQRFVSQYPNLKEDQQKKASQVLAERQKLEPIFAKLPKVAVQFTEAENKVEKGYLVQELQSYRLKLELQNIEAQLQALDQYLKDPKAQELGKVLNQRERSRVLEQIQKELPELAKTKAKIQAVIESTEKSILSVGLYDEGFSLDQKKRRLFQALLIEESSLYIDFGLMTQNELNSYQFIYQQLDSFEKQAQAMIVQNTTQLKKELEVEKAKVNLQQQRLAALQQQANLLAGQIVSQAFYIVLSQIDELIMENNAALLDVYWSKKSNISKDLEKEQGYRRNHIDVLKNDMIDTK